MMHRGSVSTALLLATAALFGTSTAGCGGKAKPAPTPAPEPKAARKRPPPPPPVCVPGGESALVSMATADGDTAEFCVGDGGDEAACFAVALADKKYKKLDEAPTAQSAALTRPAARMEATPTEVKVCSGEDAATCKTLKPKVAKGAANPIDGATDAEGKTAVLMLGAAEAGRGVAEVWDVTKGKKTATIKYARGDNKCGSAQVLGTVVFVNASVCSGPAAKGALYTFKGKKLGDVGGKDFGTFGATAVQVDDKQWAFLEEGGGSIALVDVTTGKSTKTIDLVDLWSPAGAGGGDADAAEGEKARGGGNPGESALVRGGEGKLVVIAGAPMAGSLGIVDVASGEVQVIPARACADSAAKKKDAGESDGETGDEDEGDEDKGDAKPD